jgi:hypothetical protein
MAYASAIGATAAGVPIFVVGFGIEQDPGYLDRLALLGGEPCDGAICAGHQFHSAPTLLDLEAAITRLVAFATANGTCR